MKVESKRVFISDLPETATKDEIQNAFGNYGDVTSIDIKERKQLGPRNTSLFFAYVTINADAKNLNTCFNDFSKGKWLGGNVVLQLARKSFLDKLMAERRNENKKPINDVIEPGPNLIISNNKQKIEPNLEIKNNSAKVEPNHDLVINDHLGKIKPDPNLIIKNVRKEIESDPDLVIKNNRGKMSGSKTLKIESVGKEPIIRIETQKKKAAVNTSEANLKRLESLKNLKQGYQNQKSLIQAALSNVDSQPKNKIIFDDTSEKASHKNTETSANNGARSLFDMDSEEEEEEFVPAFSVKEHFQGKEGQKLLELQSKYKYDKRFALGKTFLEVEDEKEHEDVSIEQEKKNEYEILEKVLGKKIVNVNKQQNKKNFIRFDPSQPEHSKYEMANPLPNKKEQKRKRKNSDTELMEEKRVVENEAPKVSKEIFFKVSENLKSKLEEKKEFSLLSMFGTPEVNDDKMDEQNESTTISTNFDHEKNPFRYDSSDEDETENTQIVNEKCDIDKSSLKENVIRMPTAWTDPFFFKSDDYRLQEGFDFVERMKSEETTEFTTLRRELKGIVKGKVRNNLRKNKPFKKKLGGNRKKANRMKKALKR